MKIKTFIKENLSNGIFNYRKIFRFKPVIKNKCRILMYHSIRNADRKNDLMGLAVSPETFNKHMQYLKDKGFFITGLNDLFNSIIHNKIIPDNSIVITFDDGFKGVLTEALPILQKFDFTATLFVNIFFVEKKLPQSVYWHDWQTLSWDEIRKLHKSGLSIGSHALTHNKLTELDEKELKDEIITAKEIIEKKVDCQINTFSYPHGAFNSRIKKAIKDNNFLCACSSIEGINDLSTDVFALKRTEITVFDDSVYKFEKKIFGCYDWLGARRKWSFAG